MELREYKIYGNYVQFEIIAINNNKTIVIIEKGTIKFEHAQTLGAIHKNRRATIKQKEKE